jgi:hypothetical protein
LYVYRKFREILDQLNSIISRNSFIKASEIILVIFFFNTISCINNTKFKEEDISTTNSKPHAENENIDIINQQLNNINLTTGSIEVLQQNTNPINLVFSATLPTDINILWTLSGTDQFEVYSGTITILKGEHSGQLLLSPRDSNADFSQKISSLILTPSNSHLKISNSLTVRLIDNRTRGTPQLGLNDSTANSGFARSQTVAVTISNSTDTVKWCLSESQITKPSSAAILCEGGAGPNKGWFENTAPTSLLLSSGDGFKKIYLWIANDLDIIINDGSTASINLDSSIPSSPALSLKDPNTNSTQFTNQNSATLTLGANTDIIAWCLLEQLSSAATPVIPNSNNNCWQNNLPTTVILSSIGTRRVYLFTKDAAGNISNSPSFAEIDYSITPPITPTLLLSDSESGSLIKSKNANVSVAISNIPGITRWCISQTQTNRPALGTSPCSDWTGTTNGWISGTVPSTYQVSSTDALKTVYLWIADRYNNVSLNSGTSTILLDTTPPANPTSINLQSPSLSPSDNTNPSFQITNLEVGATVKLYQDNSCTTESTSQSVNNASMILTSATLTDGVYNFSVKVYDEFLRSSSCVVWSDTYTLDTAAPTLSSVNPATLTTTTGGTITITGTHFVQGMTVNTGPLNCGSVNFISSTSLSCLAPGFSEVSLDIIVTKPAGLSANLSQSLTYIAPLPTPPICFNNNIAAIQADSTNIYVGGNFTQMGTCTGGGVPISTTSGLSELSIGNFPKVAGVLNSVISDNNGGFYIGGSFTSVGGQTRYNLAQINADMSLNPIIGTTKLNGAVNSLIADNSNIYIGGGFTAFGSQLTSLGAIIDPGTSTVGLNQQMYMGSIIKSAISDGVGGFYIGGNFTLLSGGLLYSNLVHQLASGTIDLTFMPQPNGIINTLLLSGGTLFTGGDFTTIGGQSRNRIASLNATTGAANSWNPNANWYVTSLALSGGTIFVGGNFTTILGQSRSKIASFNTSSGAITSFNPSPNATVNSVAINGGTLYIGGLFNSIAGQTRRKIGAINISTGSVTSWNPDANNYIYSLAINGSTLYAGGDFTSIGGQNRNNLAAIDTTTGSATAWNPIGNGTVNAITTSGSLVYAGGNFSNFGGQTRRNLVALDSTTGSPTSWDPCANGIISTLAHNGSSLFAGGSLINIGGQCRNSIAAIDKSTGALGTWNPSASGAVYAFALDGSTLYAGGYFTTIAGQARNRLAAFDVSTGLLTTWDPNANYEVLSLLLDGSIIYAGGNFSTIGGQSRNRLAALDTNSGSPSSWDPNSNGIVHALAKNGSDLYAGGRFSGIGGQSRNYLAALDTSTGSATAWNPNASNFVYSLLLNGTSLYTGGNFSILNSQARNALAKFSTTTGSLSLWNPNIGGTVNALAINGSTVYAGGALSTIGGQTRNRLAALTTTGSAILWNPNVDGAVNSITLSGTSLYFGGNFATVGGQSRNYIAAVNTSSGSVTNWNPNASFWVNALLSAGTTIYVGGNFTSIGGQPRSKLAEIDSTTGSATSWNPTVVGMSVYSFALNDTSLYVGGWFDGIGPQTRYNLAELSITSGSATPWDPSILGPSGYAYISSITVNSGTLFAGGYFTSSGGHARNGLCSINKTNGTTVSWNPNPNISFQAPLALNGTTLYTGGYFTNIGGQLRSGLAAIDTTTGIATSWNPNHSGIVSALFLNGTTLYVAGASSAIDGSPYSLLSIDTTTGSLNFP